MKNKNVAAFILAAGLALSLPLACSTPNNNAFPLVGAQPTPCSGVFGNNVKEPTQSGNTEAMFLNRFQAARDCSLIAINVYIYDNGQVQGGVYADDGSGNPTTLLADTGPSYISNPDGWNAVTLSSSLSLKNGTHYWLAMHTNAWFYSLTGSGIGYGSQDIGMAFGSLPATYTGGPYAPNASLISLYGTTCP